MWVARFVIALALAAVLGATPVYGDSLHSSIDNPESRMLLEKIKESQRILDRLIEESMADESGKVTLEKMRQVHINSMDYLDMQDEVNKQNRGYYDFWRNYPEEVGPVFIDSMGFTGMKTEKGRDAREAAYWKDEPLMEQLHAFYDGAQTKRMEMFEHNYQSNIRYGLSTPEESAAFNALGKVVLTEEVDEHLRNLYSDYKAMAGYIEANPNDDLAARFHDIETLLWIVDEQNREDIDARINELNGIFFEMKTGHDEQVRAVDELYDGVLGEVSRDFADAYGGLREEYRDGDMAKSDFVSNLQELRKTRIGNTEYLEESRYGYLQDLESDYHAGARGYLEENHVHIKITWNSDLKTYIAGRSF